MRDYPVIVPYGLIDKVRLFPTTHSQGIKMAGMPSLRTSPVAWNELNGLVLAAMLGVTGPQAAASTGWERIPELPKEPADVVQNRVLKGLDDIQQRWVYLEFDEPVSLGSLKVSWFMLFTRTGFSVSELYVDGGKGGWLHATTTVSAVMVEAYLRDAKTPNPD
jgi:hypothetical protein